MRWVEDGATAAGDGLQARAGRARQGGRPPLQRRSPKTPQRHLLMSKCNCRRCLFVLVVDQALPAWITHPIRVADTATKNRAYEVPDFSGSDMH